MPDAQAVTSPPLKDLTDAELIHSLPPLEEKRDLTAEERAALDELWRRYSDVIRTHLRRKIYAGRSICPLFWLRDDFFKSSLSRAYMKFLGGVRRATYSNFAGYLCTLAYSAAVDEQREITGERPKPKKPPKAGLEEEGGGDAGSVKPVSLEQCAEKESDEESDEEPASEEPSSEAPVSGRPATPVSRLRSKLPDAFFTATKNERRKVVRALLDRHARQSERNAASTVAVRMYFWQDYTWEGIAERLLHDSPLSSASRAKAIARFVAKDCDKLKCLLQEEFGITGSRQL